MQDHEKQRSANETQARLFIVEFDLRELSGHFFNQVLGFRDAAEKRGMTAHVVLPENANPTLAEPLAGHRVIRVDPAPRGPLDYEFDRLTEADRQLRSLWDFLEGMKISRNDIVLVTSGRPEVIYSLGTWLDRLAEHDRPAVFFRFFDHPYLNAEMTAYGAQSRVYRFAAQNLALKAGQERVFFTVNNASLIEPLSRLCTRRVFEMPLPKYYGDDISTAGANDDAPVVYVHVNARCSQMMDELPSLIRTVLDSHPELKVLLKYCLNALPPGSAAKLDADLAQRGVELIPSEQSAADYLKTVARSDIVLLPYDIEGYMALASGIFAEGAAMGKVIVYPGNSWMAQQVRDGHAAGVGFDKTSKAEIGKALLDCVRSLSSLSAHAQARSKSFRDRHSCLRNLDLMRDLARQSHDMSLVYTPGRPVRFSDSADSRGFMGRGWSATEAAGVWTDGPTAEMLFRLDPCPDGPLKLSIVLTPFTTGQDPQAIVVSAGGTDLAEWRFPAGGEHRPVSRDLTIPARLLHDGVLRLKIGVRTPSSPKAAGIGDDTRLLGAMFHEMTIVAAQPG